MGDEGRLYVPPDEVPEYKSQLRDADLILPNQFEAELLSGTQITSLESITTAIAKAHREYRIPHIIITSIRLPGLEGKEVDGEKDMLAVIGSTATGSWEPRLWRIDVLAFPVYFSGTGDMFAALISYRMREAVFAERLQDTPRWISPDKVSPTELPAAKAAEKVLASMQSILGKTYKYFKASLPMIESKSMANEAGEHSISREQWVHLQRSKAAEVRVVRNVRDLIDPPDVEKYRARELVVD